MKFTVNTTLLGMLFKHPEKVLPVFNKEFRAALTESALLIQRETVARTPANTGALRQSIGFSIHGAGIDSEAVIGTPLTYALPVELGAAPHFPPRGPIELWAKQKNITANVDLSKVSFLIARKISITGLTARRMFSDALEASSNRINKILNAAQERILGTLKN